MNDQQSRATRITLIATALATMFPLPALGQQAREAAQFDPLTIWDTADSVAYAPRRTTPSLSANCTVAETIDFEYLVRIASDALYAEAD